MFSEDQNKTLIPLNSWRALKHSPVCAILRNFHLDYPRNAIVINWIFYSILLQAWRETKNLAKQVQKTCNKPFEMHKKCMQHQPVMWPNCNTPAGAACDWSLTVHDASDLPGRRNALDFCLFCFCFRFLFCLFYFFNLRPKDSHTNLLGESMRCFTDFRSNGSCRLRWPPRRETQRIPNSTLKSFVCNWKQN